MPVPRDSPCPKRGPGLAHTVDGDITCVHCGQMTTRSVTDMFAELIIAIRQSAREQEAQDDEPEGGAEPAPAEEAPPADPAEVGVCEWIGGHWATAVWYAPRLRKWFCREHYARIVEMSIKEWRS